MARWEHYEVWTLAGDKWSLVGSFMDFEVAAGVARARRERVRLVRAVFEDGKRAEEQLLIDIGSTRKPG